VPQNPARFRGADPAQTAPRWDTPAAAPGGATVPAPPVFVKTTDSNEWVAKTLRVQARYARVLVVQGSGTPPGEVAVTPLDLNATGPPGPGVSYPVNASFRTLQEASTAAMGGDLVAVMPGTYQGFSVDRKPDAGDGRFVHFRAMGKPGEVTIDRGCAQDPKWMILVHRAHHVIIEGFNLAGPNDDAGANPRGPNAGIFIDGDFGNSSRLAHHVAVIGNFSHHHRMWGLHSTDTHSVLIQDNLFSHSAREHGAYVSDGSDNYVIRRNVFFSNRGSGLQCNVDPLASLEETMKHPAMAGHPRMQETQAWAEAALRAATERFGAHGFPDGRGYNFIIEGNVMNGNGRSGGAAINLAGVRESLIQNNLVYGNQASGVAMWDNANPFDAERVKNGPKSAAEMKGPEILPIFGCYGNVVRNNTVVSSVKGRPSLLIGNGSWGTRARNNILVNDREPSIEVTDTGIWRTDAGFNVVNTVAYEGVPGALKPAALNAPEGNGTQLGMTQQRLAAELERAGAEPWVSIEGTWWLLNPKRPSFRPKKASRVLAGRGDARDMPAQDLTGVRRSAADIGAYAAR
jgi:hypothetical protein